MVWTRKSTAPTAFNLGEAFAASVTGNADWDWVLGWLPISGGQVVHTDAFCALGPPADRDIDASNFFGWTSGSVVGAIARALLISQLQGVMRARLFGAMCEQVTAAGVFATWLSAYACADHSGLGNYDTAIQPVPAGATHYRVTFANVTSALYHGWQQRIMFFTDSGGSGRVDYNDGHPPTDPSAGFTTGSVAIPAGHGFVRIMLLAADSASVCADLLVEFDAGGTETHTPVAPTMPDDVIPPTTRSYPDIAALGAELDAQELKLDTILQTVMFLAGQIATPGTTATEEAAAVTDDAIDIGDAVGIVVHVASVPAGWGKEFGVPERYFPLGRITLTTPDGDLPAIDITQITQVVTPLPPGVSQAVVFVKPPMTGTYVLLAPQK